MSANPTPKFVTVEEYLKQESRAQFPSEYFNGQVFPMFATSPQHAAIVMNVGSELRHRLKDKPCRVYGHALILRVSATGLYTYPDVTVICGEPQLVEGQKDAATNPVLIVEVLSPSTQDYDRGQKFQHYRTLPTLVDYLMVAQETPHIEHWIRQGEDRGLLVEYSD